MDSFEMFCILWLPEDVIANSDDEHTGLQLERPAHPTQATVVLKMNLPKSNSKTLRIQATTHSQKTPNNQKSGYVNTAAPLHKEKWYVGGGAAGRMASSVHQGLTALFLQGSSLAQDSHTDSNHHICTPDSQKEVEKKRRLL